MCLNAWLTKTFCKKVGEDSNKNKFYTSRHTDYLGRHKRSVILHSKNDSTSVDPMWHSWLHYTSKEIPSNEQSYKWQIGRTPNTTGTANAYSPSATNDRVPYHTWHPE